MHDRKDWTKNMRHMHRGIPLKEGAESLSSTGDSGVFLDYATKTEKQEGQQRKDGDGKKK